MVLLAVLLLIGVVAGLVWLTSMAWGSRGRGWPGDDDQPSSPWRLLAVAVVLVIAAGALIRIRAIPLLLLLIPLFFVLSLRGRRRIHCATCGETVDPQVDACRHCGSQIR